MKFIFNNISKNAALPSTLMVHSVLTSPHLQVYLAESSTVTFAMTSWCKYWSIDATILSSGLISSPSLNHWTGLFGLVSSHFRTSFSFSFTFWSWSGFLNSGAFSEKWKMSSLSFNVWKQTLSTSKRVRLYLWPVETLVKGALWIFVFLDFILF